MEAVLYSPQFSRWMGRRSLAQNETGEKGRQAIVTEQKSDCTVPPASQPARNPFVLCGHESKVRHHDCAFLQQVQLCGCSIVGGGSDLARGGGGVVLAPVNHCCN